MNNTYHMGLVTVVSTMVPGHGLFREGPLLAKNRVLILFFTTTIATFGLQQNTYSQNMQQYFTGKYKWYIGLISNLVQTSVDIFY